MSLLKDKIELEVEEAELGAKNVLARFPAPLRWLLVLLVLALIPAYFLAKNISYQTWLKRYQAGQLTAKPSFTSPEPPKISDISVTGLGPGQYAAAVKITNPNLDLSLNQVPFSFVFYNAQKQQVYSYSGRLFLLPNQTKYITVPTFSSAAPVVYDNFTLPSALPWQKKLAVPKVTLITPYPNTYEQAAPPAFVVEGSFSNQSPYTLAQVRLTFLLFDGAGKIIGLSQRDEFTVAPFERRTYKQLWPNISVPNLGRVEVAADTNTLDGKNIIVSGNGSSADLSRPTTGR